MLDLGPWGSLSDLLLLSVSAFWDKLLGSGLNGRELTNLRLRDDERPEQGCTSIPCMQLYLESRVLLEFVPCTLCLAVDARVFGSAAS